MTQLQAIQQCDRIVEMIDDDVPDEAKDRASDFFEDVREKVIEVQDTVTSSGHVTSKQQRALDNWEAGVAKWIK